MGPVVRFCFYFCTGNQQREKSCRLTGGLIDNSPVDRFYSWLIILL